MLFHIKHTHRWETCPYHDADRARETFGKAMAGIAESDVQLVGAYVDAAAHTTFLLLDATSASQIEAALISFAFIASQVLTTQETVEALS